MLTSNTARMLESARRGAYTATEPNGGGYKSAAARLSVTVARFIPRQQIRLWMPLGTVFRMKDSGRIYKVEDYGSALVGRKTVDIYMPNDARMNAWGVREVDIEILELGSYEKSLEVLKPRRKCSHVRKMVAALEQRELHSPLIAANTPSLEQQLQ